MTKLQRIDQKIAELDKQLSNVYAWMDLAETQAQIDFFDKLSLQILSTISALEVSRHEARMMQHHNAGRYDQDSDFIS